MHWPKTALILSVPFLLSSASAQPKEKAGAKDPELFSRIPGYVLINVVEKQFDFYEFFTTPSPRDKKRVEAGMGPTPTNGVARRALLHRAHCRSSATTRLRLPASAARRCSKITWGGGPRSS